MTCPSCSATIPDGAKFCTQCGNDLTDPGTGAGAPAEARSAGPANLNKRLGDALGSRYELGELLGRGGMGAVFKAVDTTLERPVAVKVLPPELAHDEKFVGRFEREARTAAKLDHPGIIPIYAVEHRDDLYYFVMKYVTGRALDQVISQGSLPLETCQRILWESACALGHAHQRGVVHRDIKPANIMIDEAGRAMLTDFGISKASQAASQFTATGQVIGTPHYMSPEQAKGLQVDGRSDQYSLGVVGYKMLTGRLPFAEESVHTVIYKHIFEEPTPVEQIRGDVPLFMAAAIKRTMAKDPEHRFTSMEEFATAIWPENPVSGPSGSIASASITGPSITDAATQVTPPSGPVPAAKGPPPKPKKKVPAAALVGGLFAIVGGAAGAYWLIGSQAKPVAQTPPATAPTTAPSTAAAPGVGSNDTATAATQTAAATPPAATQPSTQTPTAAPPQTQPRPTQQTRPQTQPPPQVAPAQPVTRPPVTQPTAPPQPQTGLLTVSATPFGTLFVDGVMVGDTPIANHQLSVGRHIVEVRKEGYQPVTDTVQIQPGTPLRKSYRLRPGGM